MNEPLLVFREIEKSFSGSQILCGVDLSMYPGKCILLSGKADITINKDEIETRSNIIIPYGACLWICTCRL